jgi:hypothetical protein
MNERSHHWGYVGGALAILGGGVVAEAVRLVAPWPGFVAVASRVVSVLLIVLWASTALLLPRRNQRGALATSARLLAVAAPFAMLAHASVTRVGGSRLGLLYAVGAAALTVLLVQLFAKEREPSHRRAPGNVLESDPRIGPPSTRGAI